MIILSDLISSFNQRIDSHRRKRRVNAHRLLHHIGLELVHCVERSAIQPDCLPAGCLVSEGRTLKVTHAHVVVCHVVVTYAWTDSLDIGNALSSDSEHVGA